MTKTTGNLLTPAELVARWKGRVTEKTLRNWRHLGRGPTHTTIARRIFYAEADLRAYEKRKRKTG